MTIGESITNRQESLGSEFRHILPPSVDLEEIGVSEYLIELGTESVFGRFRETEPEHPLNNFLSQSEMLLPDDAELVLIVHTQEHNDSTNVVAFGTLARLGDEYYFLDLRYNYTFRTNKRTKLAINPNSHGWNVARFLSPFDHQSRTFMHSTLKWTKNSETRDSAKKLAHLIQASKEE